MNTNEIINNEEVMNATEEIVTANSDKVLMAVAGVGLAVLVTGLAYKYIAKPMIAKHRAKKEQQAMTVKYEDIDVDNDEEVEDSD